MDRTFEVLGLLLCCGARLGIPVAITLLLAWGLRRLDAHWKAEAEAKAMRPETKATALSQARCWEVQRCPPNLRKECPAFARPDLPCWEAQRLNGHLREACRDCQVLGRAVMLAGV